ncbi:MAG: lysylphosphatidylglycerol synthase transmembrane domain-containing protein, partial [Planctomycetota bacterium]
MELQAMFMRLNLIYLILAVVTSFAFAIVRGIRWKLIVSPQKSIPVVRALTLYSAGQLLNSAMPALTGQVGRLILFARKESLRKTFVFGTMVLEVLFDAISLIIFVFFASFVFPFPSQYRFIGFIIAGTTALVMIGLYLILHFQNHLEESGRRRLRDRWPGVYITIKKFIRSFTKGIELLKSSQHLFGSIFYSLIAWTVHMLAIYLLFRAFDLEVPFTGAAV